MLSFPIANDSFSNFFTFFNFLFCSSLLGITGWKASVFSEFPTFLLLKHQVLFKIYSFKNMHFHSLSPYCCKTVFHPWQKIIFSPFPLQRIKWSLLSKLIQIDLQKINVLFLSLEHQAAHMGDEPLLLWWDHQSICFTGLLPCSNYASKNKGKNNPCTESYIICKCTLCGLHSSPLAQPLLILSIFLFFGGGKQNIYFSILAMEELFLQF